MSSSSDWSNVRVKEEPMSDFEDGRRSSYNERDRDRGSREGRRKDRRSPSPPPSHSRHRPRTSPQRSRSRSRSNSREREREGKRRGSSRWEGKRSGSGERDEPRRDNRRRPPSRERESDRSRFDDRRIKQERRSPSPRFRSPPPRPGPRRDEERRDRGQAHSSRDRPRDGANGRGGFGDMKCYKCNETGHISRNCPQGGSSSACFKCGEEGHKSRECQTGSKRERDWNNFFNPKSEMSQQAYMKREKEEQDRKVAIGQGGGGAFGKNEEDPEKPKEQPNFGLSGKLTEETNTFRGVVVKYSEPPEARKPNKIRWRLYPFKGEEALQVMYIHRQSAYLLGRDRKVADIPVDHPSCSKQHAVLQYRLVPYVRPDGSKGRRIKPYIIDLESANGTFVNEKQIDPKRYVELFEKDVLKFGFSSREYVLLHDESKDIQDDSPELTPD